PRPNLPHRGPEPLARVEAVDGARRCVPRWARRNAEEVAMSRSTLPLFPTDEGWPYPDVIGIEPATDDEPDLDALELRADPHAFDGLTLREREALFRHFGLRGERALSMRH